MKRAIALSIVVHLALGSVILGLDYVNTPKVNSYEYFTEQLERYEAEALLTMPDCSVENDELQADYENQIKELQLEIKRLKKGK